MPNWINVNDREPEIQGNYFTKYGLTKDISSLERITSYIGRVDNFFWLDESDLVNATMNKIKFSNSIEDISKIKYEDIVKTGVLSSPNKVSNNEYLKKSSPVEIIDALNNKYEVTAIENLKKVFGIDIGLKFEKKLFDIKQKRIKNKLKNKI